MARYSTPVRDFTTYYPHGKYKWGERTVQQGVTQFGRKTKNGCKLASTAEINRSLEASKQADKLVTTCKLAFPGINLEEPSKTPRVIVTIYKSRKEAKMPTPAIG